MISFRHKGDFERTSKYLSKIKNAPSSGLLDKYGNIGVAALASATPIRSGETASSWSYEIESSAGSAAIRFNNSHINKGVSIALILQYGHGTGTGGWVEGRDYINPAVRPVFDSLVEEAWKEVTSL